MEWTKEQIDDFASDFLDINMGNPNGSAHDIADGMYEEFLRNLESEEDASRMARAVRMYVERIVSRMS